MRNINDELMQQAGLDSAQAAKAISITVAYLKSKFPKALHQEIETVMKNGNFGDAFKSSLRDLSGQAEVTAKEVAKKADEMLTEVGEKLRSLFNKNS